MNSISLRHRHIAPSRLLGLAIVFFLALTAHSASAAGQIDAPDGVTTTDALGRTVALSAPPERIVLAGRGVIMLVDALYLFPGVAARIVAVGLTDQGLGDFFPVVDANADAKVDLGRSAGAEEIAAQHPDLVVLKTYMRESAGLAIEAIGIPVLYLDLETPEQFARDLRSLGDILGNSERAEAVIAYFDEWMQRLRSRTEQLDRPGVVVLSYGTTEEGYSFSVAPKDWIQGTQVDLAGGEPLWFGASGGSGWNQVQFEQIALWNPDVIVFLSFRGRADSLLEYVRSDPLWSTLEAVHTDRVYAMPHDFYSWGQPDPRWVLGAEWLARVLHPDAVPTLDFQTIIESFFEYLYGISKTRFAAEIEPHLAGITVE